jgi:hypothetical protein
MVAKRHKITNVPLFKKQKSLGPLKMSLEMAHKVIVPQKKNYVPQFLKQRDINSYKEPRNKFRPPMRAGKTTLLLLGS